MKLLKRVSAVVLAAVMIVSVLPATLTSAALYEGLQEQEDGRLAYVQENPAVPMGSVAVQSVNSSGKATDYSSSYTLEDGNVIVMDVLDKDMNQVRDWIGNTESSYRFIITDNVLEAKADAYLEGEIPIEPLVSVEEGIDHTKTLAADAKEVAPGVYTYRENARGTVWTITLGELVEPSEGDQYTIVTDKNAIVEYDGSKYLVIDGYVDTEANGLKEDPENPSSKYFFADGILRSNGIEIFEGYYLSYGKLNGSFTGFVNYDEEKYYVVEGVVSAEDGAFEDPAEPGTYYYVTDGKVDTSFTGTVDDREFVNGKSSGEAAEGHVVITCSDRHDNTETLQNILRAMPEEPAPEAIIHNGDAVNSGEFAYSDIAAEFTEIFPDAKVFFSYGSHDSSATDLADVEPSGVMYETDDYILYDISMNQMQTVASAEEGAAAFTAAAANFDTSKVLFVASHMPLHTRRGDNLGAATWFAAINEVAANMDTVVLWSHNHTGENNTDTQNYLRMPGELMTPQGGSEQAANFIYANAGYIIVGYMTQWTITDNTITIQRYNAEGAVTFHDGVTYPVVFNRNTGSLVAGDINHDEAGDGESTGGSGGGGGGTPSYYTTSEAEAAKLQPEAGAGDYVFLNDNGTMVFTWTITLNEDNTYDIEEIRGSFGTSYFHGESWSAEGAFITLGPNDTGSRKGGWCDPEGFYMIVYPDTDPMSFLPSLTPEGNPDEEIQTGWVQEDGKWFYYNEDGEMVTGWLKDGDTWYYLNEDGSMATGWFKSGDTWYYLKDSGAMAIGWQQVGSTWYYLKDSGAMATGWQQVGGTWYYLKDSGAMMTGWLKDGSTWYYFKDSGAMVTGWQKVGSTWYFFKSSGAMAASEWCEGYWLNADGSWTYQPKGSWKQNSTGWWFGDTSGWYAKNSTVKIDNVNYKFNAAGYWVK